MGRAAVGRAAVGRAVATAVLLLTVGGPLPAPAAGAVQADVDRRYGGAGTSRIETAVALSREAFGDGAVDAVVVAYAFGFPDALAAAPVASAAAGPVLLNERDRLNGGVAAEIRRLGADRAYLMGGPAVQSEGVRRDLEQAGLTVQRVAGADRMATAAAAAHTAVGLWRAAGHTAAGGRALVALGAHPDPTRAWPDALASGALAGTGRFPLLLTHQDRVPAETNDALRDLGTQHVTVVGGTAAIPDSTRDQLAASRRDRIGGATRFETSTRLADESVAHGARRATVLAATGNDFPDGLAAAPVASALGGVLVLVAGRDLVDSSHTKAWLEAHRGAVGRVRVAGGRVAVADEVLGQIGFALSDLALALQPVASGFDFPVHVAAAPGEGGLYVVEKPGRIKRLDGSLFLDITGLVSDGAEQGLLGLAFHPGYAANGRYVVHYTDNAGDTVVAEYRRGGGAPRTLLTRDQPASNHNGGSLEFGPDGHLYVGLGDGGGSGDRFGNAQDAGDGLGAIVRLHPDTGGWHEWMHGLRNPYRFSFDPIDGLMHIGDVGQNRWEEVDVVAWDARGTNFGWPCREGAHPFDPDRPGCPSGGLTDPVFEYPLGQEGTCAVTGGMVYRGSAIPALRGQYLYGDYCGRFIRGFHERHGIVTDVRHWISTSGNVTGLGRDHGGEVYVTLQDGTVQRIVAS
ncbi:MAG TPA: cell wall-binding repeat-containing protein [Nitriliruptorales bacterium]|nr:cell wall-binding repeat-containing protein [Nitriliruptorales bacterium]